MWQGGGLHTWGILVRISSIAENGISLSFTKFHERQERVCRSSSDHTQCLRVRRKEAVPTNRSVHEGDTAFRCRFGRYKQCHSLSVLGFGAPSRYMAFFRYVFGFHKNAISASCSSSESSVAQSEKLGSSVTISRSAASFCGSKLSESPNSVSSLKVSQGHAPRHPCRTP